MGRFVEIAIEAERIDTATMQAVLRACPVDIFVIDSDKLSTNEEREDECILCGQCVVLAAGTVSVRRAYGARRPVLASNGTDV